ncbi:hypothetical protein LTR62_008438 [Meristemomyces frigidus]|uniref:Thymidylate kinase n=1 Tax=Meristemomyces frigidus TaxID=1508187 RepID=A0AAN7THU8_9PEZI|nr:hypothetical protein LTR62_008438 [Meristemomyces frigidus]
MAPNRGSLIVLEGLDRSGKSTQCERLVTFLRHSGHSVSHLRFPNRSTPIGQIINNYLSGSTQTEDHVIHLLFSANRWESAAEIERLIQKGTTVVIDRYYYSGCVYTAAKQSPGMDLAWCRQPEVGLPRPDLCLFLDVSAEVAEARGGFGGERYEKREMQAKVRELFAEMRGHRDETEDVVVVTADDTVEMVGEEIKKVVLDVVAKVANAQWSLRKVEPWS